MSQRGSNWKLILCMTLMGLVGYSAFAASAESGTPECAAEANAKVAALTTKNGRHPSNEVRTNILATCSEKAVGRDLEGLFASHSQETLAQKEARCQASVAFAKAHGLASGSDESLVQNCLSLPSDHNAACGFDSYSVVDNQKCVTKSLGISSRDFVAKGGKRVVPREGGDSVDGVLDPGGTSGPANTAQ
jgi:hypothetical protein